MFVVGLILRRGWDSNPRYAQTYAGFQDRCIQPGSATPPCLWTFDVQKDARKVQNHSLTNPKLAEMQCPR